MLYQSLAWLHRIQIWNLVISRIIIFLSLFHKCFWSHLYVYLLWHLWGCWQARYLVMSRVQYTKLKKKHSVINKQNHRNSVQHIWFYLKILQSLLDFLVLTLAEALLGTYWPWGIIWVTATRPLVSFKIFSYATFDHISCFLLIR